MIPKSVLIFNEKERRQIDVDSILFIEVTDYLSTFYLHNKQKIVCSKPLCKIATLLPIYFFQINRSQLVNLKMVLSGKRHERKIILSDSTVLTLSTRRIRSFHEALARQNLTLTS